VEPGVVGTVGVPYGGAGHLATTIQWGAGLCAHAVAVAVGLINKYASEVAVFSVP